MVIRGGTRPFARLLFFVWVAVMLTSAGCSDDGPRSTAVTEEDALTQGKTLVNSGRYADAIIEFNRAIELNSKSVDGFKYRAVAYFYMQQLHMAIHDLGRAIDLAPADVSLYLERARFHFAAGNHEELLADCTAALELDPAAADAWSMRAGYYCEQGMHQEAIEAAEQATKLNPEHAPAYNNLAVVYMNQRKNRLAIQYFDLAIQHNRQFSTAYGNRAKVHFAIGHPQLAYADWAEAIRLEPNNAQYCLDRGIAYLERDRVDEALQDFQNGIARLEPPGGKVPAPHPFLSRLYTANAEAQMAKGLFDKALASANEAIRLDKTSKRADFVREVAKSKQKTQSAGQNRVRE
jgi:tetratricopeptide (TPR) repeat protein